MKEKLNKSTLILIIIIFVLLGVIAYLEYNILKNNANNKTNLTPSNQTQTKCEVSREC